MEWFIAIIAFAAIVVVTQYGKHKALQDRRRRIELRILKNVYEKSNDHDTQENLIVVAQLLTEPEMDILLFNHDDTTSWWKGKIYESDKRASDMMDRLGQLLEETEKMKEKSLPS